jgi:hypothetical protein
MVFNLDSIESGCHHKRALFPVDADAMTLLLKNDSEVYRVMTADGDSAGGVRRCVDEQDV